MYSQKKRHQDYYSDHSQPFHHRGSSIGVLLIHPITATPDSFDILKKNLLAQNYSIAIPCLAGHGSRPIDLETVTHHDWLNDVEEAYQWLNQYCRHIFVIGISASSLLALSLATDHPNISGIIIANPLMQTRGIEDFYHDLMEKEIDYIDGLELFSPETGPYLTRYDCYPISIIPSVTTLIDTVRKKLPRIISPLMIFTSEHDTVSSIHSSNITFKEVQSSIKAMIILEHFSTHLYFTYHDLKLILQYSEDFFQFHAQNSGRWMI